MTEQTLEERAKEELVRNRVVYIHGREYVELAHAKEKFADQAKRIKELTEANRELKWLKDDLFKKLNP